MNRAKGLWPKKFLSSFFSCDYTQKQVVYIMESWYVNINHSLFHQYAASITH